MKQGVNPVNLGVNPVNQGVNPLNLALNLTTSADLCGGCKVAVTDEHHDAVCCDKCSTWWHDECVQVGLVSRAIMTVSTFMGSPMPKYGERWYCKDCL